VSALAGIKVLDLSRVLAGPWAGQLLADYGADAIKVEQPGKGDDTRAWGPPYLRDAQSQDTSEAAYYLSANRNKRSVTINLAHPEGQRLVRELALQSDIVIENFKVGGLKKYGLDAASLLALNPRLIYCSITGFGQTGPLASEPGYDAMIQAQGGLMSITGHPDGMPGGGPMKVGIAVVDLMCGMYAVTAILAALQHRERSGVGQHIDVALLDTQVAWLSYLNMNHLTTGMVPPRYGTAHPSIVPYQAFATADGHLMLTVGNDGQFQRFCACAGAPALSADPRFARNADRVRHRDACIANVQSLLLARTTAEWLTALRDADVPAGPINTIDKVFEDAQVQARGMRMQMPHPIAGEVPLIANPVRFSETPVAYRHAPPLLGEHTESVLIERLGLDPAEIARLRAAGVV
jgi:crotonobetainyl-CoA:carnitine CoA-transferase CaiB-like acyl-CoA transferase